MKTNKYDSLAAFLREQPSSAASINLSFADIELIIGSSLPRSARSDRTWWGNSRNRTRVHSVTWLSAGWKVGLKGVNLREETVVFVRSQPHQDEDSGYSPQPHGPRDDSLIPGSLYANLTRFLKALPLAQEQLALSFDEMSEIMGQPLPQSASDYRPWWANTQGAAWMSAGWKVDSVYLPAGIVVFRRRGEDPLKAIPKYVQLLLDGTKHVGSLDSHRLARWIRFCRRVGWYFQGTVLYEKSGADIGLLSEVEQVEIDEDYAVCKRELGRYKQ